MDSESMKCDGTPEAIDIFAACCEELNEYARELRRRFEAVEVRTGSDIRRYQSGWRLEKYVEAGLRSSEQLSAAWWLDLGWSGQRWIVSSNVSVSHSEIHIEFPERAAANNTELKEILSEAVDELTSIMDKENQFGGAVRSSFS